MPNITKEQIADWADELAAIAISLKIQIQGTFQKPYQELLPTVLQTPSRHLSI